MDSYQKASDMVMILKDCINKMSVVDDKEGLFLLHMEALRCLSGIYNNCKERLEQRDKDEGREQR